MEDRELLELAAKAAGLNVKGEWTDDGDKFTHLNIGKKFTNERMKWNPLSYDGDALRLAVQLQLGISIPPVVDGRIEVVTFYGPIISIVEHPKNDDRNAATRRAIVRAAAEIGKQMA